MGLGTAVPGGGMVIPCCWKASAIGVPPTAAVIAAASCGLAAVTVSPSGKVTFVGKTKREKSTPGLVVQVDGKNLKVVASGTEE